jgi:hypothetical protein
MNANAGANRIDCFGVVTCVVAMCWRLMQSTIAQDGRALKQLPPQGVIERDGIRIFASSFNKSRVSIIAEGRTVSGGDIAPIDAQYGIDRVSFNNCTLMKDTLHALGNCGALEHLSIHQCDVRADGISS